MSDNFYTAIGMLESNKDTATQEKFCMFVIF